MFQPIIDDTKIITLQKCFVGFSTRYTIRIEFCINCSRLQLKCTSAIFGCQGRMKAKMSKGKIRGALTDFQAAFCIIYMRGPNFSSMKNLLLILRL
jgi:hypothetical protein